MKAFRIQILIALLVLICGTALMGIIYIVFSKPEVYVNPGVVVSKPSPVSMPVQPMRMSSYSLLHNTVHPYSIPIAPRTTAPTAAMQPSRGLYTTSSAHVQTVGGGAGHGIATTSGGSAQRGISYTTNTVTTFATFAANRQVAAPEAQRAPEIATLASGPRRAPGPPTTTDLQEKDQLVEHSPVGTPLVLALMAGVYAIVRKRKEDAE